MTTLGYAHHSLSVSTLTMTVIWKTSHLFSAKKQRDSVPQGGTQDCTRRKHLPPFSRERLSEDSFNSGGLLKYIFICSHLRHIFITSSSHLHHIFASSHLLISHLHIFTSSLSLPPSLSLFSSSHLLIFSLSPSLSRLLSPSLFLSLSVSLALCHGLSPFSFLS